MPQFRTSPNATIKDNWSTRPNINPFNGKSGTRNPFSAPPLHRLAKYYRDLMYSLSASSAGKHLIDVSTVMRYKLTADLGLFIKNFNELIEDTTNQFPIEKLSSAAISRTVAEGATKEEADLASGNGNGIQQTLFNGEDALTDASASIVAIYRKQQFDPFNREVIIGFPLISGNIKGRKYCAPLLYFTSRIDFDPLRNIVTLTKDQSIPALNFHFLKQVLPSDEAIEMVRRQIIGHLHEDDFDVSTIKKIVDKLANLNIVKDLSGITFDPDRGLDLLSEAIKWRDKQPPVMFNTVVIINARRSNPYLLDDLAQLTQLEIAEGISAIDRILNPPPDRDLDFEFERDPAMAMEAPPLFYPLKSNRAQRIAASKAENAQLMVVQGPPGTGKSQTIVNLACHLISQGKTVLISSHQSKALEVITKNLPKVDYLAMSLLKGEKQSLMDLLTKIEGFNAYVSGRSLLDLMENLDNEVGRLKQNDIDIKRLSARFSELKKLERDKYPMYRKYHDLRQYDLISASDSIPEGMDLQVAKALEEYKTLLGSMGGSLTDLMTLFPVTDTEGIEAKMSGLEKVLEAYEWVMEHLVSDDHTKAISKKFTTISEDTDVVAGQLQQLSEWVSEHLESLRRSRQILASVNEIRVDPSKVRGDILKYREIIKQARERTGRIHELLSTLFSIRFDGVYPDHPDEAVLKKAADAIAAIEKSCNSWLSWRLGSDARMARKELSAANLPAIRYVRRKECLTNLKSWHRYWCYRKEVMEWLTSLKEVNFPFEAPQKETALATLIACVNIADVYNAILDALMNYPCSVDERLTSYIDSEILKDRGDGQLGKSLMAAAKYIDYLKEVARCKKTNLLSGPSHSDPSSLVQALIDLEDTPEAAKTTLWLKGLREHFSSYMGLIKLEYGTLKTLPATCRLIKYRFVASDNVPELEDTAKVVEAFRISGLVRDDLINNPDDINEIATRIGELRKGTFSIILKVLDLHRKLALKKASQNPATLWQVNKLKQVLKRRRKTHSFMHLRDQIDYEKLLTIFPCWIMNIDDVGRIFPLNAGLFDYLIIDEASQCNQAAVLPLAFRAKRMIVVGDDKQMKNPNTQFLSDTVVQLHLTRHGLDIHPNAPFLDGRKSLLDLALGCQDIGPVFLNEHFRSEPPIIHFSNEHFYDNGLRILTPFRRKHFKPCMEIRLVPGAFDDPDETRQNVVEAKALIAGLAELVDSGELDGDAPGEYLSVGILSLFRAQATLLQNLVYEAFAGRPDLIQRHEITVSTVDGFQGDERDVILYSFRYAPNSKPGSITAIQKQTNEHDLGRLNVAFSRARRKVICFTSVLVEHFPRGLVRDYLEYVTLQQKCSMDRLGSPNERQKCQSKFEEDVFDDLVAKGLTVYAQVPCAGFFIDFVVFDGVGRRLAVECDGDFHYEDGELREEDYQRQDIIERYVWVVYRIPSRRYYSQRVKTIDDLLEALSRQESDDEVISRQERTSQEAEAAVVAEMKAVVPEESKLEKEEEAVAPEFDKGPKIIHAVAADKEEGREVERVEYVSPITFQGRIMDLLSAEGDMPVWMISDKLHHHDKLNLKQQLEAMALQGLVERVLQNGVKVWRTIN
jgi:very-short-patch-repair endonuclease